jgi:RNA polymerase sigma-70 factor (ECF subfamily)
MPESDASLVRRARLGDGAAAGTLLRRYFRASYLVAMARLGNRLDAEDACQDAFVRCLEHLDDCRDPDRFGPWLLRIVRNTAHNRGDYLRIREAELLTPDLGVFGRDNPETSMEREELRTVLRRALGELSLVQREVVLLHDLEGWRHAEIADRLELSETMSRRHLSDARKRLRSLLGEYPTLEPDHD